MSKHTYGYYKELLVNEKLPCAVLDEDLLIKNVQDIIKRCNGTKIRIATKSIRCISVLKKIVSQNPNAFCGFMAFTLDEAVYLTEQGLDDVLLGYPYLQDDLLNQVAEKVKSGSRIVLMADLPEHLAKINEIGEKHGVKMPVCIDIDMSVRFPGVYFGVYRSHYHDVAQLKQEAAQIKNFIHVDIVGAMGYEAQIAGVGDNAKGKSLLNGAVKLLKKLSYKKIAQRRQAFVDELENITGKKLDFVNAGGTGSIETSIQEPWVTEVTVGSGFYSPGLFDNYTTFKHEPALFYGLEITRKPKDSIWTAAGGGYTASGSIDKDKRPKPYLPLGIKLEENEGVGEVQTPMKYKGQLTLGDPVFFRHAKAGELCERFNELIVVSDNKITNRYKTYRGEGKCFL